MKTRILVVVVIAFCVAALPLTTLAESRTWTPPAEKGNVYVIVRFTKGGGVLPQDTNVSVRWGSWSKSGRFNPGGDTLPKYGFVIKLRHTKNDSVPLTVSTDGRIENIYQGDPPAEWSSGTYHIKNW